MARKATCTSEEETWELYNVEEDFSLVNNIADKYPESKRVTRLFKKEAIANNVYPLDDRLYERFNAAIAGRPDLMGDRTSLTLAEGMTGMLENTFLNVKNRSVKIDANVSLKGNDRGVILCQGGKFGGWTLYMNNGKPAYAYNYFGLELFVVESDVKLPSGKANIVLDFKYDGGGTGKGGVATIYVDGKQVAQGRIEKTVPAVFSADETADVGVDEATQVQDKEFTSVEDSEFTGVVDKVTISISE